MISEGEMGGRGDGEIRRDGEIGRQGGGRRRDEHMEIGVRDDDPSGTLRRMDYPLFWSIDHSHQLTNYPIILLIQF